LTYSECSTVEPETKCSLENPIITTEPLEGEATTTAKPSQDLIILRPATGNIFGQVDFSEKDTCAFDEQEPILGQVTVLMPNGASEAVLQSIEGLGSIENNSLQVAGDKAFIEEGATLLKLASGAKWSFR
jgi:hypothetical protein